MTYPTFAETATRLVSFHPPKDAATGDVLGDIRDAFKNAIDRVTPHIPEGPDAQIAARKIHDACQACLAAVVLNQEEP
jgi:hypothetical protein